MTPPPPPAVLGVDVGGTTIKAMLVDPDGKTFADWRIITPTQDTDGTATVKIITEAVRDAAALCQNKGWSFSAPGVVVPGIVEEEAGICRSAVNLGWENLPVRSLIEAALATDLLTRGGEMPNERRIHIAFGQDVRAAALAETRAAHLTGTTVFVPLGTGVACATINDGQAAVSDGKAGEIGQIVLASGPLAGLRIEDVVSAGGLARRVGTLTAREAVDAAKAGDLTAGAAWADVVAVLADVLSAVIATVAPKQVVIGGGLAGSGGFLFGPLAVALNNRLPPVLRPTLLPAQLGEAAAAHGAVELARALHPVAVAS